MRRIFRIAGFIVLLCFGAEPSAAQSTPQQANADYSPGEIVDAGSRFFGGVSSGLAHLVEHAVSQWGLPNGYILGQEATGAFVGGLRYGKGTLFTKNAGDLAVYWQGPSLGWDFGGDGARTMMLVYNLPATGAVYQRFGGVAGSAYFVGGLGMTVLSANGMVVVADLEPVLRVVFGAPPPSPLPFLGDHRLVTRS